MTDKDCATEVAEKISEILFGVAPRKYATAISNIMREAYAEHDKEHAVMVEQHKAMAACFKSMFNNSLKKSQIHKAVQYGLLKDHKDASLQSWWPQDWLIEAAKKHTDRVEE